MVGNAKPYEPSYRWAENGRRSHSVGLEWDGYRPKRGEPTIAPPGTDEKLKVFQLRLARGENLFHEADARYLGDPRPLEWVNSLRV